MGIKGFDSNETGVSTAWIADDIEVGTNPERDRVWIEQKGENYTDIIVLCQEDVKQLIKLLEAWVDSPIGGKDGT